MDKKAQGFAPPLVFLIVAIILGLIAVWGFVNLNIWAMAIGIVGEIAWFFIFGRMLL